MCFFIRPETVDFYFPSSGKTNVKIIMAITKAQKVQQSEKLAKNLSDMQSLVFVNFKTLPVKETILLRRKLRGEDVKYTVIKKTLLKRVLDTLHIEGTMPELGGEIAIAYSTDLLKPAAGVFTFAKETKTPVEIVGGIFEGKYMDKAQMTGLATIPSREVLLSQIAFLLKSPLQRLAIAVNEVAKTK